MNAKNKATCERFRVFMAADKGPALVQVGGVCFVKGTKALKVAVPIHLRNKVGDADGNKYGKTTGLKVVHFVDALLRQHCSKATGPIDDVLEATLLAEFPARISKASGVKGVPTVQGIAAYRAYHNAGKHGCDGGKGDGHYAPRYDAEGNAYARREAGNRKPKAKAKGSKAKANGKPAKAKGAKAKGAKAVAAAK